MNLQINSATNN